ncbi:MAG: alpha-glucosidase/alpha-galactosidase [Clostridiales bacterium]|nr:alpha-glucosidase/alpha-galactosidase [Clostridiales bacterium]PWM39991.1 MAG: alpha-glucosidase/alpha-galactosidase [Clostridiales bacterium]
MSFKIAFIGAGSIGFTRRLLADLLTVPEFHDIEVAFTDINAENLRMVYELCQRDIEANGLPIKITTTLDRREAFRGAKYVINSVRIGMLEAFEMDVNIPLKYGVDQCVGDTLCAGGVLYGQRSAYAALEFCRDIEEVAAPGCILLNYANPNAMVTWMCNKYSSVKTIGLCHGVQGGHRQIAEALGYRQDEVDIICAGINHMTWYISVKHNGEDLTGKILEAYENDPKLSRTEKVRIDMLRRFGYYSTESNGHLSEYIPWYRKNEKELLNWIDLDVWDHGETGGYLRVCQEGRSWFETDFPNWMKEPPMQFVPEKRSQEHGSYIIESLETGRIYRGHFNVVNNGAISNLPDDCIVEVPGYVDANGINITRVGDLPLGPAACCMSNINVQRLAVEAAYRGDDLLLKQALMLDPLTGAVCTPPQIWQMADEMLIAEEKWLPQYADAIAKAKIRMEEGRKNGTLLPTREGYQGAARLHTKTVEEMRENRAEATRNAAEADKSKKD